MDLLLIVRVIRAHSNDKGNEALRLLLEDIPYSTHCADQLLLKSFLQLVA